MLLISIFVIQLFPENKKDIFINRFSSIVETEDNHSNRLRILFWKASIYAYKKNPIIGTGFCGLDESFMEYFKEAESIDYVTKRYGSDSDNSHNSFLSVLGRHGTLVGGYIVIFMLLIFPFLWFKNRNNIRDSFYYNLYRIVPFATMSFYISALTENVLTARTANLYAVLLFLFSFVLINCESEK